MRVLHIITGLAEGGRCLGILLGSLVQGAQILVHLLPQLRPLPGLGAGHGPAEGQRLTGRDHSRGRSGRLAI